jgi:GTP-binding protein EngB required for normal cell division
MEPEDKPQVPAPRDPIAILRVVVDVPGFGVTQVSASSEEELRKKITELREASLDY